MDAVCKKLSAKTPLQTRHTPQGNSKSPVTLVPSSRAMQVATQQKLVRNCTRNGQKELNLDLASKFPTSKPDCASMKQTGPWMPSGVVVVIRLFTLSETKFRGVLWVKKIHINARTQSFILDHCSIFKICASLFTCVYISGPCIN